MKKLLIAALGLSLLVPSMASAAPKIVKRLTGNWGNPDLRDRTIKIRAKKLKRGKYRLIFVRYVFGKRAKRSVRYSKYGKMIKLRGKNVGFSVSPAVMRWNKKRKQWRIWWRSWRGKRVMRAAFFKAKKGKFKGKWMIHWYRRFKRGKKVRYRYGWRWKKRRNTRLKIGKKLLAAVRALIKSKSKAINNDVKQNDAQANQDANVKAEPAPAPKPAECAAQCSAVGAAAFWKDYYWGYSAKSKKFARFAKRNTIMADLAKRGICSATGKCAPKQACTVVPKYTPHGHWQGKLVAGLKAAGLCK